MKRRARLYTGRPEQIADLNTNDGKKRKRRKDPVGKQTITFEGKVYKTRKARGVIGAVPPKPKRPPKPLSVARKPLTENALKRIAARKAAAEANKRKGKGK